MRASKILRKEEEIKVQNKQIIDLVIAGIFLITFIIFRCLKLGWITWIPFVIMAISLIHLKLIGKRR